MIHKGLSITGIVATAGLLLGLVGCSDNPVAPMKTSVQSGQRDFTENLVRGQVEIYGRVATTNTTTNSLTVTGHSYDVQVPSGAELVFKDGGSETPIEFGQIAVGDSIEVRGNGSGNVLTADRVRIRPYDNANTELEFGGRIEFVDTVTNQIKLVNDARMIFAAPFAELVQRNEDAETIITLGAIHIGDSVEIKGNTQPDGSITASRVRVRLDQMSGGDDFRAEIEFKTTVLSIDYANGTLLTAFCWQVVTDSMTFIFGSSESEVIGSTGAAARRGHDDNPIDSTRTRLTLADLKVGDTIQVYVQEPENRDGDLILSLTMVQVAKDWEHAEQLFKDGGIVRCKVIGFNKGGLLVQFNRIRGFVPASQVAQLHGRTAAEERQQALQKMVNQEIPLKVIEVDRERNRLVLSERSATQEWRKAQKQRLLTELQPGDVLTGRVNQLTNFGAFIDLGGADGLAHISELSWQRVTPPR